MAINHEHQLTVLKDILSEHQLDRSGTVAECEQIERLAKSLIANDAVHSELKQTLSHIYTYSQNGKTQLIFLHTSINMNNNSLNGWIN